MFKFLPLLLATFWIECVVSFSTTSAIGRVPASIHWNRSITGISEANTPKIIFKAKFDEDEDGVVELVDEEVTRKDSKSSENKASSAPFLSQGEISEEALNPDFTDPKQTRVIIYIILSLLPVLFLIPLMLGSRELIPLDALPPVQM